MQAALNAPAVVAGFCWPTLDASARRRTARTFAGLAVLGVVMLEPPRWRWDLVRNSLWLPALFLSARAYGLGGHRDVRRARSELHLRQCQVADEAACRGEREEWERIDAACREALASVHCVSPAVRPLVERRLRDLKHLAEEYQHAG